MKKIELAKIINTHALKGELKLELYTDFPFERFIKGKRLFIDEKEVIVDDFRIYKNNGYIKFLDFNSINDVEIFKNKIITINIDEIPDLDDGYYFFQLKGLIVKTKERTLGEVVDIIQGVAQNLLKVKKSDGKTFYIPYVECFVKDINLNNKEITVELIEGLE